jgi:hypothetical protein
VTDIFHDWKQNRFIHISKDLVDYDQGIMILLTDVGFWVDHTDELINWCRENRCVQHGMTVTMPSEEELTLFCLRWC